MVEISASVLYPIKPPQCEALRDSTYASDREDTNKQCRHRARYKLQGIPLCDKHAKSFALQLLLAAGGAYNG